MYAGWPTEERQDQGGGVDWADGSAECRSVCQPAKRGQDRPGGLGQADRLDWAGRMRMMFWIDTPTSDEQKWQASSALECWQLNSCKMLIVWAVLLLFDN